MTKPENLELACVILQIKTKQQLHFQNHFNVSLPYNAIKVYYIAQTSLTEDLHLHCMAFFHWPNGYLMMFFLHEKELTNLKLRYNPLLLALLWNFIFSLYSNLHIPKIKKKLIFPLFNCLCNLTSIIFETLKVYV